MELQIQVQDCPAERQPHNAPLQGTVHRNDAEENAIPDTVAIAENQQCEPLTSAIELAKCIGSSSPDNVEAHGKYNLASQQ